MPPPGQVRVGYVGSDEGWLLALPIGIGAVSALSPGPTRHAQRALGSDRARHCDSAASVNTHLMYFRTRSREFMSTWRGDQKEGESRWVGDTDGQTGPAFGGERDGGGVPRRTLPPRRSFSASASWPPSWAVPAPGAFHSAPRRSLGLLRNRGMPLLPPRLAHTRLGRARPDRVPVVIVIQRPSRCWRRFAGLQRPRSYSEVAI